MKGELETVVRTREVLIAIEHMLAVDAGASEKVRALFLIEVYAGNARAAVEAQHDETEYKARLVPGAFK